MKAIVHDRYGAFDLLGLRDIDKPVIAPDQVLVRVHSAGLHVGDCFGVRGAPLLMRVASGLFRPKLGIPGFDLAGTIEAAGKNVTRFELGDQVFGASFGTCAEYASAKEDHLALKPANLSFEQAAAIPTSGLAALHALRDVAKVQSGQKILINGASGGVGHFAVQIGKSYGAEVTGVCSTRNVELVRSVGADHVIDYSQEDFTKVGLRFDLIFDNVENRSLADCRRALTAHGMLILNSGTGAKGLKLLARLLTPILLSPFVRQDLRRFLSVPNHEDLVVLKELVEAGNLTPFIEKSYALKETPEALRHIDEGHARGKVVVRV